MTKSYLLLALLLQSLALATAFVGRTSPQLPPQRRHATTRPSTRLHAANNNNNNNKLTALPPGLSPFEKSLSKSIDVQGNFRKVAGASLARALKDGVVRTEIDFPPLLGGDQSKSNFDDFDNVQELNANRDWCVQLLPALDSDTTTTKGSDTCWLVLPDDKEVELAKDEWKGQRFRQACQFTSIRAAVTAAGGALKLAWGSTLASTVDKLQGGDGILADTASLDSLDATTVGLTLVCQPGNGGPVEDWINVEQLQAALPSNSPFCIVNGALDKVRSSYYPAVFFPALAATKAYYDSFEAVFFLKPIVDKGLYGWLFRVYPEPWQVVLQTPTSVQRGDYTEVKVANKVALVSAQRPTYLESVQAMLATAAAAAASSS
jgi:hypothetical protein